MFAGIGIVELLVVGVVMLVISAVPIGLIVWGVVTLMRIRSVQNELLARVAGLEGALRDARAGLR